MITIIGIVSAVVLLVMLNFTTPTQIGPLGVLVFFTTVYILFFCVFTGLWGVLRKILGKRGEMSRKEFLSVGVVAFAPIILLLIQAFTSVNILTVIGVVFCAFLGCFLVNKRA